MNKATSCPYLVCQPSLQEGLIGRQISYYHINYFSSKEVRRISSQKMSTEEHQAAAENFIKLGLSYRFTVTRVPSPVDPSKTRLRFAFSKPTEKKPEPEIVVYMDAEVVSVTGSKWVYSLFIEGQKFTHTIKVDSANVTGKEFNEKLIDKVFEQKSAVRQHHRCWVAAA